jgi:hypothetical protein
MKPANYISLAWDIWITKIPIKRLLPFLFAGALTAGAQSVVTPVPSNPAPPPDLRQAQDTGNQAIPQVQSAAGTLQETSPYKWGPVTLYPHFLYRFLYGNGIQATPGQQLTTAENSLSPGFRLDLGSLWTLDYTPTWTFYSNHQLKDTLDHALNLAGGTAYEDWVLQFTQNYNYSNDPLIETGSQTTAQSFLTAFTASYHFGRHMLLDSTISQNLQFTKGFSDSRDWSDLEKIHYQFSKNLDAYAGLGLGYVKASSSPDMTYITPSLGIICRPADKISLEADAGFENRRFLSSSVANTTTPIFSASIGYQPVTTTKLTVTAKREVDVSPIQDQITRTTTLGADLNQRLLQNFYLDASYNHESVIYVSSVSNAGAGRDDNLNVINVKLSTTLFGKGTVAIFYQDSHNSSNASGFSFTSHQAGFELGYRY